jgi:SAM-dependent methyltransferase
MTGIKRLVCSREMYYHIVDLGCGTGDTLRVIARWARRNKYRVNLTGIDNNKDAIEFLKQQSLNFPEINGIAMDYKEYLNHCPPIDIIHSSLFCHHLADNEVTDLFRFSVFKTRIGFVMNDLRRNRISYYSTKILTTLANGTTLSKNDGPVSVLRGFTEEELHQFLKAASVDRYILEKKWAYRFSLVGYAAGH